MSILASLAQFGVRVGGGIERRSERLRYDLYHASLAGAAYEVICTQEPDRRPDRSTLRVIDDYAREVLGSQRFSPWLRVYTAWAGSFAEGWIPDNYYGRVVNSPDDPRRGRLSRYKTLARRVLHTDLLPDLAYHVQGAWLDRDGRTLASDDVDDLVFADADRIVAKFDGSSQGRSVHVLHRGRDDVRELVGQGDFVVQRFIAQAGFFRRFSADSVATIRITTVRRAGHAAETRAHYLRLGRAGQASVASASNVRVPIVDRRGTLGAAGCLPDWTRISAHPDSGASFAGEVVPAFEKACAVVEGLHDALPQVDVIGWDVAITDDGDVRIMEWNAGHSDIKFSEASIGPCFHDLGWENLWRR